MIFFFFDMYQFSVVIKSFKYDAIFMSKVLIVKWNTDRSLFVFLV